ncbi:hypothetical protein GCM10007916_11260 [Psychromonas marina]|uniref:chitinase n=1 Tax=Psychromonas marina TaxID=88364 RepID=A0ABQ6DY36_9GAMM|nr:glycosyl hydrolase family 18 protein [Psychromonas marina]GLS90059.1 hypothetical protein GCM10007916_11260 [Psychromonas marina]
MYFIFKRLPLLLLVALVGCDNQFTKIIDDNWIKDPEVCEEDSTTVNFKQVAYWTPDDSDNIELVDFSMLTHIIYSSIIVNADASLVMLEDDDEELLEDLVTYAQPYSVKTAVSLGEWVSSNDSNFNTIAGSTTLTDTFVDNVIDFLDDYELEGVDIHWQTIESDDESDEFEKLLKALSKELVKEGKFLSMTVPSGEDYKTANRISSDLFDYVDFVNVIVFDEVDSDDFNASLQDAKDAIEYWTDRCLIKNKLVLGVPFYSVGSTTRSYDYLLRDDLDYVCVDNSRGRDYNGIPTIIDKTDYALSNAGGMMMRSLEQDVYARNNDDLDYSEYSLLNVINETVLGNEVSVCQ